MKNKMSKYVSKLSPVKRIIGEKLLSGVKPATIARQLSKGRKNTSNAKAYITMVQNGLNKLQGIKPVQATKKRTNVKQPISFLKVAVIDKKNLQKEMLQRFDRYAISLNAGERFYDLSDGETMFGVMVGVDPATDSIDEGSKLDKQFMTLHNKTKNCAYLRIV